MKRHISLTEAPNHTEQRYFWSCLSLAAVKKFFLHLVGLRQPNLADTYYPQLRLFHEN